ncbi:MBL fold metallo-hydrolase [Marilutibacter chinensis]|uniref:MBL fold metallo-hydrolase n=1 Tax=Marilutibacter chinensis TaxID=2912247 RepID=A0ABS9HZ60_9GAMM|nr:MBL fold metallo-hydrolase [Lysobacter chinensis]MCF7223650.1 MBL fold metallo-hydrolase [Lysobacter chinensis]
MAYLSLGACSSTPYPHSPQFRDGAFRNPVTPAQPKGWRDTLATIRRFIFEKPVDATPPAPPPVLPLTRARLLAAPDASLFRLGHSTVLIKLDDVFWLTDPVFSERASPVQWAGPKRFHAPPIDIAELPPLQGVILSHDHYDHLDRAAVQALAEKTTQFLAPLGVGDLLVEWGIDPDKIVQLDWWEEVRIGNLRLVATPAQHFSGRRPFTENPTLWASWVIVSERDDLRLFFSGDSGYFDGFRAIGEHYGPFDMTLLECGAYDASWSGVHMHPEQTLQAHLDLRGRWLLPVHNGTFDLALHGWSDPLERIAALAGEHRVRLATPMFGQAVAIRQPQPGPAWWLQSAAQAATALPGDRGRVPAAGR